MTEVLIGVLGVVAGSVATAVLQLTGRLWHYFKVRLPADHNSLYNSSWALTSTTSTDHRIRVQCVFAPDRSSGRTTIDPTKAIALVHAQFPGEFPEQPAFSMPGHGVRFDRDGKGLTDGYTWVWVSGRMDYDCYVEPVVEGDHVLVPILEVLKPIAHMARVASSDAYRELFGRPRLRAQQFDWFVGVSPSLVGANAITSSWTDVVFPGRRPKRAGQNPQPFCPSVGYAAEALRSWSTRQPVSELLRAVLVDFLHQNGYYDCEDAIQDTLTALDADAEQLLGTSSTIGNGP
jgi:hypothetical protein